jgi:hypothetical protein
MTKGPLVTHKSGRLRAQHIFEIRVGLSTTTLWLNLSSSALHVPRQVVEYLRLDRAGSPTEFGSPQIGGGHAF